jgi:hypothetical protein
MSRRVDSTDHAWNTNKNIFFLSYGRTHDEPKTKMEFRCAQRSCKTIGLMDIVMEKFQHRKRIDKIKIGSK